MSTYQEKLDLLSQLIAFAESDAEIGDTEYGLLLGISRQLGVGQADFEGLFGQSERWVVPRSQLDRIVQFHRLVLLMNVDDNRHPEEIHRLHAIGMRMGLRPSAVQHVLTIMHRYPDKVIPPDVLISIFKVQDN